MRLPCKHAITSILFVVMMLFSFLANAQSPLQFNFQGLARYRTGTIMSEMEIKVRLNIRREKPDGIVEYTEIRSARTNQFGMFTIAIGSDGSLFSSGSLKNVQWSDGKKYLEVEVDPRGGNDYIQLGATQLLSVPFALYSLESGNGKNAITSSASNGLSFSDTTLQLGNVEGDTSSKLSNNRQIPLNGHSLKLRDGAAFIDLSKSLVTLQQDSSYAGVYYRGGTFLKVNPIFPKADALPFLFNRSSHEQHNGVTSPNEVVTWGHNLEPGGYAYIKGLPAIGYSLESNYLPDPQTRFVESHEYYVTPQGKQVRLKSYTINTASNSVDFYQSVDNFSLRKPTTDNQYFYIGNTGSSTMANWETSTGRFSIVASDDGSVLMDNGLGSNTNLHFTRWGSIILPGILLSGGNNRLTANTFPELDYTYSMGNHAKRWAEVASYKFSGEKMILKSGWAAYDNITPTASLDIAGENGFSQLRMRASYTPSSSSDQKGEVGATAWDDNFIYIKTSSGWKRSALSSF